MPIMVLQPLSLREAVKEKIINPGKFSVDNLQ